MGREVWDASVALWPDCGAPGWPALPVDPAPEAMFAAEAVSEPLRWLLPEFAIVSLLRCVSLK
jgi:hypothetical protein